MRSRRLVFLAATSAAFLTAAGAFAVPSITPQTLQCDGVTYLGGNPGRTGNPNPSIQAIVQDPTGLRIGQAAMGTTSSPPLSLWRFDTAAANVSISDNGCAADAVHCPIGGKCWTFGWSYTDANGLATPTTLGQCIYDVSSCTPGTANNGPATYPAGTLFATTPASMASCPAPPTLPLGTGQTTFFPAPTGSPISYAGDGALEPNGSEFVVVNADTKWLLGGSYTMSAWIKTTGGGTPKIISYDEYWYTNYHLIFGLGLNAGKLELDESRDSVSPQAVAVSGPTLNDGLWHKVDVVRRDGIDRRLYADGNLIATFAPTISTAPSYSTVVYATYTVTKLLAVAPIIGAQVTISTDGIQQGPASNYFTGQIDELRVIGAALSDDEIKLEYLGSNLHKYAGAPASPYGFVAGGFSGGVTNGYTASAIYTPGEAITTASAPNQRWIFEAQNTNTYSNFTTTFTVAIDSSKPTPPSTFTGAPFGVNAVEWSWAVPGHFCPPPGSASVYYQLFDAVNGGPALNPPGNMAYPATTFSESGGPNQLLSRQLLIHDTWGNSPLTPSASAYTNAAVPTGLTATSVSTGGFIATWSANGNPGYTRYELTYTSDPSFAVGVSTRVGLADNFTGTSIAVTGLTNATTYYVRVYAFNGRSTDVYGGVRSAGYASLTSVVVPPAPTLSGSAVSSTQIQWNWSSEPGATGYTLRDSPTQTVLFGPNGGALTYPETGLAPNTRYSTEVDAEMPAPAPPTARGYAFAYTQALPPSAPSVYAVYPTSAVFSWNPNGNPPGTFYQIIVSTDATFGVVTSTLTVSTPTVTAAGLLPGVTYYARVEAVSGGQMETGYGPTVQTATAPDPEITVNASPPTPYLAPAGLVGAWQFDENAGTTTADSSVYGNTGNFGCAVVAPALTCVSTPTFTAGPAGLGSAASFSGLTGGRVLTNTGNPFNFTGSVTVEAWVDPVTAAQTWYSGIAAVGNAGSEDFAIDVSSHESFEFLTTTGGTEYKLTVPTATIVAGRWTHVVGVYDSAHSTSTLYVNGVPVAVTPTPGVRANLHPPLAIGNRQDGSGNFTLPFAGGIDSVRVIAAALTPAQVKADYQGSFISSVTPSSPNNGVIVALPPNAFGAPAQIFISADPVNHPIRISPAALSAGLAVPPPGLTLVPGSLVEIVPVVGGLPFTTPLGSSATLTIPYKDPGNTGLISGTNPPLAAAALQMYTLNTAVNSWAPLPTTVDRVDHSASGLTPHFSVFALFAPATVGTSLAAVKAFPVPWKPGSGGRFDAAGVTFANLPAAGTVRILTLAGRRVREFSFNGVSAGSAVWDGTNDDGRRAASGVYFARISSSGDGSAILVKFAVER